MGKRFLSRELIISEAFQTIDESGTDAFSVRGVAARLGVQVSSLYNHIENEFDLLKEVAKRAAAMYTEHIEAEVAELGIEEATYKAGDAFRVFLKEHWYLYDLMLDDRWIGDPEFDKAIERFTQPIYYLMSLYGVTDKASMDYAYVAMRVVTHGFGTLDSLGLFDKLSVDPTESYHRMIRSVIEMMKKDSEKG